MIANQLLKCDRLLVVIFGVCFCFWVYLFFSAQMSIHMDAVGYEYLGNLIVKEGWVGYFSGGIKREPLYPASIAFSMLVAQKLSISYQSVQTVLQLGTLFITQTLIYYILKNMNIRRSIRLLAVFYVGISPAFLNAALSLYSEIITFPFVLLIVWLSYRIWSDVLSEKSNHIVRLSVFLGLVFVLAVFAKGIFRYVYIFFQIPFAFLIIHSLHNKRKIRTAMLLKYFIITATIFHACLWSYMGLNKKYNGKFELTNRYAGALYGMAYKRTRPLTSTIVLSHLSSIPGGGVCRIFFTEEECKYCEFYSTDKFRDDNLKVLLKDVPKDEHFDRTKLLTKDLILEHPFRYALFTMMEAPKMFFWESTKIGFVNYPDWLKEVHDSKLMRWGLRLFMFILTFSAFLFVLFDIFRKRREFIKEGQNKGAVVLSAMSVLIIVIFTGLYSLFLILTRYALPIAPLFVILIAYMLNNIINIKKPVICSSHN